MFGYSKLKAWSIISVLVLGIIFAIPTFIPKKQFSQFSPKVQEIFKPATLGLDLQGGSYLLMEVDTDELLKEKLTSLGEVIRSVLRAEHIRFSSLFVQDNVLSFSVLEQKDVLNVRNLVRKQESLPLIVEAQGNKLLVQYTEVAIKELQRQAVQQSLEIVRKRVDEMGTKEPQIQQEGDNRIVIQLAGVQDPSEVKALMGKTAKMSFHMVDEDVSLVEAQMGKISFDSMLVSGDETGMLVLKRTPVVSGADLETARAGYDEQGLPIVEFSFKTTGAKKFDVATRENVGRRLASVLDGKILSAPVINTPITGGQGMISGNFTVQSANDLALFLRSGALPAPLNVIDERIVGPGLGEDSIKAGATACVLGVILVAIFMVMFYGFTFGTIANITLISNGILILALLNILNATLTLPGIAGIVLTIAMAVDANIIVFERIKEEKQAGTSHPKELIMRGFKGSFSAIMDGQLTTLFAALFLFWLGSGPVRGFGVTLGLGLLTTLFTAVILAKFLLLVWYFFRKPKEVNL